MGKTDKDLPWKVYYERNGEHANAWHNGGAWHTKENRRIWYKINRARAREQLGRVRQGDLDAADHQDAAETRTRNSIRYDWY